LAAEAPYPCRTFAAAITKALRLIVAFDTDLIEIVALSHQVTAAASAPRYWPAGQRVIAIGSFAAGRS
jgi:hypothetical protein